LPLFQKGPFHIMARVSSTCHYHGGMFSGLLDRYDHNETGFRQICTVTRDYDRKKAQYEALGYELACELTSPGQRVAFFGTVSDFGFFIEVAEEKTSLRVNLSRIPKTCAHRDGTDPIRILTRDGYRTP
jgi:hypothetical protein